MASKRAGKIPPPLTLAINVCEDVVFVEGAAAFDLMQCFTTVYCSAFPALQWSVYIHLDLTNGRGVVPLTLQLYAIDNEDEPLVNLVEYVEFEDPRSINQICIELGEVVFPKVAEYTVSVYAWDEKIAERRIFAILEEWHEETE